MGRRDQGDDWRRDLEDDQRVAGRRESVWRKAVNRGGPGETPYSADFSSLSKRELRAAYQEAAEADENGHAFAAMDMLEIARLLDQVE